jgi:Skp family chaperone for outer membrane proteins
VNLPRPSLVRRLGLAAVVIVPAFAGGVLLTRSSVDATAMVQPASPIGVVDVGRISRDSAFSTNLREDLQANVQRLQQELQQLRQQLTDEEAAVRQLATDSDQFRERAGQIIVTRATLQAREQVAQAEQAKKLQEAILLFNNKLDEAVRGVAQARGLSVVLRRNSLPSADDLARINNPQQLEELFNRQTVLFNDAGSDITSEVIAAIDAE